MAMHPVGPLPASTYWRRRGLLLLALLVVLLVVKSCAGGDATPVKATPGVTPSPTVTKPTVTVPVVTPSPAVTKAATTVAAGACPDAAIALTPATDLDTYAVGGSPKLMVTIRNTGTVPCRRDLGSGAVELLVFSGPDRVWSSDDCSKGAAVTPTLLPPGGTQVVALTWAGKRSLPGCAGPRAQATVGTYRLVARVGTVRTEGAVFRFR